MAAAKVELPDLPDRNADPQNHLDFANQALHRFETRIARVRKFGLDAAMLVLVMENGDELVLQAKHHRYGLGIPDRLAAYDGVVCPSYTQPQLRIIFAALIRASDIWETNNTREELLGDLNTLLVHCLTCNDHAPLRYPNPPDQREGALYQAISDFQDVNRRRTGHPNDPPPIPLFWDQQPDFNQRAGVELWFPRGPLITYLRAVRSPTGGSELKNTLKWFGWDPRELQARNKGDWRRRVHARVWVIPVPWEDADLDLLDIHHSIPNA